MSGERWSVLGDRKARAGRMLLAALLLLGGAQPGAPVPAGEAAPDAAAKKPPEPQKALAGWEALTSPAEARGLYDRALAEWLEAARKDPKSPGAELALRRIGEVRGRLTTLSAKPTLEALRELAAAKDAPVAAALARELLVGALRDANLAKEADEAAAGLGLIENWLAVGTFGRSIPATHDRVFGPEEKVDLAAEYESGRYCALGKNKWRLLPAPVRGEPVEPYDYLRPAGGACYLLAQMESDKERRNCALLVKTPAPFKVWLNGEPVFDGDRYRSNLPREVDFQVRLAAGWNRLLVKLSAPSPISVRLFDDGRPFVLKTEDKMVLHPAVGAVRAAESQPARKLWSVSVDFSAAEIAAVGVMNRLQNLDDEAIALLKQATEKEPDRAAWHYHLAEAYRVADYLSAPARKNLSAAEYRAALKCDPGFVPAHLALAEQLAAENHEEQALAEIKEASAAGPESALPWLEMASVAKRLGWRNECRAWLAEAEKLAADYPPRRLLAAERHKENGNLDLAMAEYRELVKAAPTNGGYRGLLAATLADRGEWKEAVRLREAALKARPADPQAHLDLARTFESAGEFKRAAELWRDLAALVPAEAGFRRALGECLTLAGDAAGAKKAYGEALELAPGDHRLRRLLERQSGVDEDFSAPYALDIYKELETSKKRVHDRANAVRILDQTVVRVYPDGSVSEFIADGERILTDKAVEKLSDIPVLGEVVEARTIAADGTVFEPTAIPGERRLTMPGLAPEAVVEYKYRLDEPERAWGGFYLDKWYFRSPQLDEPHQVSDYIVMVPKGLPHRVVKHNFDVPERVEEKDGLIVYRWTARDRERVDAEPHMPHFDNYLPFVELGTERSWQEVADTFKSFYLGRTRPTALIRAAAAKALEGRKTAAEKARALYDFVNETVKIRGSAAGANAHQVLEGGSGDPEMLYLALAETAGLECFQGRAGKAPEFQDTGDEPATWELPAEEHLPGEVVGVRLEDGRVLWLDLSNRYLPFGAVRLPLEGSRVLAVGRPAAFFDRLPRSGYDALGTALEAELAIDAAGDLQGRLTEHTFGAAGAALKEQIAGLDTASCKTLVEAELGSFFRGAALLEMDLPGVAERGTPLAIACRFERAGFLEPAAGGRLVAPSGLRPMNLAAELAMDPSRKYPLKIAAPRLQRERLAFKLPAELEIAALPEAVVLSGQFGTYALVFERFGGGFTVTRRAALLPQTVAPADYAAFAAFCRQIDEAEKARVTLRRRNGEQK